MPCVELDTEGAFEFFWNSGSKGVLCTLFDLQGGRSWHGMLSSLLKQLSLLSR